MFHLKTDTPLSDEFLRTLAWCNPDASVVRLVVAHHFGPACIERLKDAGTFHAIYRIDIPDGRRLALRASRLAEGGASLRRDAWAMDALRARGLPSLAVHCVDLSRTICDFDYEIMDWAGGVPLGTLDGDEPRMLELLPVLGAVFAEVHGIPTEGFGPLEARLPAWSDYVLLYLDRHIEYCETIGAITAEERERIQAQFAETSIEQASPALLHGDPGSHNIFCEGRRITALIDWEDALSGDPVFDIALWATFHPERRHAAFLAGYHSVRPLPADFERRFWLYFLRIALSKTVHRHRFGYQDRPGRPPASRRIQLGLQKLEAL